MPHPKTASLFTTLALGLLGLASAQTIEGVGTTTASVSISAEVGSACEMTTSTMSVSLSPTLYWTNTSDATGNMTVTVKCNLGTQYAVRVPETLNLMNGAVSLTASLSGGVDSVAAADDEENSAASAGGQPYLIDITVPHGEVTQDKPTGTYMGSATITLEVLAAPTPD